MCPRTWPEHSIRETPWPSATLRASSSRPCVSRRSGSPTEWPRRRWVYGTTDREHPGVGHLLDRTHPCYVRGRLDGVQLPPHYDFRPLRPTPAGLRAEFARLGWRRVVAFQTRNPLHRAHQELTVRAAREVGAADPQRVRSARATASLDRARASYPRSPSVLRPTPYTR